VRGLGAEGEGFGEVEGVGALGVNEEDLAAAAGTGGDVDPGGAAGAFSEFVDQLVNGELFAAESNPSKQKKIGRDVGAQRAGGVGAERSGDLGAEVLGAGGVEEEVQVGGLAVEVLGGAGSSDAAVHGGAPVTAGDVEGLAEAQAEGFEGVGDQRFQVGDDGGRWVELRGAQGGDAFRGGGAEKLVEREVRGQLAVLHYGLLQRR